jgi:hypothetical protein
MAQNRPKRSQRKNSPGSIHWNAGWFYFSGKCSISSRSFMPGRGQLVTPKVFNAVVVQQRQKLFEVFR